MTREAAPLLIPLGARRTLGRRRRWLRRGRPSTFGGWWGTEQTLRELTHELRTPLNSILMLSHLLREGKTGRAIRRAEGGQVRVRLGNAARSQQVWVHMGEGEAGWADAAPVQAPEELRSRGGMTMEIAVRLLRLVGGQLRVGQVPNGAPSLIVVLPSA